MQDIHLFTSQPKAKFYDDLFATLDVEVIEKSKAATGNPGYPKPALCGAFIVMKCEGRLIAHYCGVDITKPLPSYWTYVCFLKKLDNALLKQVMQGQVLRLAELGIIDTSFLGQDGTPVMSNTCQNNPKSFRKDKFRKANQPRSDPDCRVGVHTASNQHNSKTYEFYWGYKNHVLCDLMTGLPLFELTTVVGMNPSWSLSIYYLLGEIKHYLLLN